MKEVEEEQGGAGRKRLPDDASNESYGSRPRHIFTLLFLVQRSAYKHAQTLQQDTDLLFAQF